MNTATPARYSLLGLVDDVTVCDCCGKKNLKCTVVLRNVETDDVIHYGRSCAAIALGWGDMTDRRVQARAADATVRGLQRAGIYTQTRRYSVNGCYVGEVTPTTDGREWLSRSMSYRLPESEGWHKLNDQHFWRMAPVAQVA